MSKKASTYACVKATTSSLNKSGTKFVGKKKKLAKTACSHVMIDKKGRLRKLYKRTGDMEVTCRACGDTISLEVLESKNAIREALEPANQLLNQIALITIAGEMGAEASNNACKLKVELKEAGKTYWRVRKYYSKVEAAKSRKRRNNGGGGNRSYYGGWAMK